jgi:prepilin-type N-terminal cleavage/methylation domain-containing protein
MKNYLKHYYKRGYTLLEVMMVVSIAVLLMTVVLYNYGQFNDRLALSSAAQEFSLGLRQTQAYAINARDLSTNLGQFNYAYGIFVVANPRAYSYIVFADKNANQVYDEGSGCGSGSTECINSIPLRDGVYISAVCNRISGATNCPAASSTFGLHVTFLRPSSDANINFTNAANNITFGSEQFAAFRFTSPKGANIDVGIENSGQINIQ